MCKPEREESETITLTLDRQRTDPKDPNYEDGLIPFPKDFRMVAGNPVSYRLLFLIHTSCPSRSQGYHSMTNFLLISLVQPQLQRH